MTVGRPARWSEIERLYHAALARDAPDRTAFLRHACGDDVEMRAEIESLLAHADNEEFLASPPLDAFASLMPDAPASDATFAPGTAIGPYTIVAALGSGGMGEVYRAHDGRLERDVALKVLPAALDDDPERRSRLVREARAAAALNHPNICTIHEVGDAEGRVYLALELIEGRTLSSRLADGPLPAPEVVRLGRQLVAAVVHAHARGVVHRDLKSANVMLTSDDRMKVLDFGLAKRLSGADLEPRHTSVTEPGTVLGTVPYMAPEQLRGLPADARTDVWALGVILYEMLAGRQPFGGRTRFEVSSAILHELPLPIADAPPAFVDITNRCLEKEPDRRYQRAEEIGAALDSASASRETWIASSGSRTTRFRRGMASAVAALIVAGAVWWGTHDRAVRSGGPLVRSIAVLPLENRTGDPAQDYFVTGMHEALITDLARIGLRKVIAKPSADVFKDTKKSVGEIARELGVEGLVTGSVARAGNRLEVAAQLVRAEDGSVLWANRYERTAGDVLALQNELVGAIARELRATLTPEQTARLATARFVNPAAHDSYLKARSLSSNFANLPDRSRLDALVAELERAIAIDPTFAPPYAALSVAYQNAMSASLLAPRDTFARAQAAALKSAQLDDDLPEAHAALGTFYLWYDWNWAAAEREITRALHLNPNSIDALTASEIYSILVAGRFDDAAATSQRILDLDPLNAFSRVQTIWVALFSRRHEESIRRAKSLLDVWPDNIMGPWFLAANYAVLKMTAETAAECDKVIKRLGGAYNMQALAMCAASLGTVGRIEEARRLLTIVEHPPSGIWLDPAVMGTAFGSLGDYDRAFAWFEKGMAERSPNMVYMKFGFPWDPVRSDRRFQPLLVRMNFPGSS